MFLSSTVSAHANNSFTTCVLTMLLHGHLAHLKPLTIKTYATTAYVHVRRYIVGCGA